MAQSFPETAHNKIDKKKFDENFDAIDWSSLKDKPLEKVKNKKHMTAGMCGEYGMSTFDDEKFKENYENIKWSNDEKEATIHSPGSGSEREETPD